MKPIGSMTVLAVASLLSMQCSSSNPDLSDSTEAALASSFVLFASTASTRGSPVALDGASLAATEYIFTSDSSKAANPAGITQVRYWLDNAQMAGTPSHAEGFAPYDFAGTAGDGTALAWDTTKLAKGTHTISQSVTTTSGAVLTSTATFTVGVSGTAPPPNNAKQYYVATSGSDANDGSQAHPWKTIQHADAALTLGGTGTCVAASGWLRGPNAGACVHVLAGTYAPGSFQTAKSGTASAQIYFLSETRFGAKISGSTWTQAGNWTNIEGFEMTGPSLVNAVTVEAGENRGVDYNYIHDFGTSSCTLAGIVNQTNLPAHADHFNGNIIRHWGNAASSTCGQGYHGIYADGDAVVITNNIISGGAGGWGIQRQYQTGHSSTSDCAPGVISNNTIFNNQGGIVINENGACTFDNWTLSNNIIVNNGVEGTCHGFNGTNCGGSAFGIDYWHMSGTHNDISNNLMYGNLPANLAVTGNGCTPGSAGCPGAAQKSDASTAVTFANFEADVNAAPASNYDPDNYRLRAGSAAVGGGVTTCAAGGISPCAPAADFDDAVRMQPPSIGAF